MKIANRTLIERLKERETLTGPQSLEERRDTVLADLTNPEGFMSGMQIAAMGAVLQMVSETSNGSISLDEVPEIMDTIIGMCIVLGVEAGREIENMNAAEGVDGGVSAEDFGSDFTVTL